MWVGELGVGAFRVPHPLQRRLQCLLGPLPANRPGAPALVLPQNFSVYGYARSKMSDEEFRDFIASNLTCRLSDS